MTTRWEFIDGVWHIVIEDPDMLVVMAEINRLCGNRNVSFIGPNRTGDKYVAKGMLHVAPVG